MSRTPQDEPLLPGETETDRINRYESKLPGGARVENDPDPENEEGAVDPDTSDPLDVDPDVERVKSMRPA
ncbi:hypothetical protein [Aureimonas sp. AU22]|uniref:hypothetical protein n=1 Tax=Aureimonas sp. AU22 TaxID=1638162 RepID=UPI000782B0ED|nr:hypothetical protein [Aureimonas sp. AU22]